MSSELSLAQKLALLPESKRAEVLEGLNVEALNWDWSFWARPSQWIAPETEQSRILFLGGRGSGKTRAGCEWARMKALQNPGSRGLLVARTAADVRDVLVGGEALSLNTLVATPTGFTKMGDIQVGDEVLGADGKPTRVTWVSEVAEGRPCYRVTMKDGTTILADENHKWMTTYIVPSRSGGRQSRIRTTGEMARIVGSGHPQSRLWIDVCEPLDLPEADLPIPPYTMGAWLGDGSTHHAAITTMDDEVLEGIIAEGFQIRRQGGGGSHGNARITHEQAEEIRKRLDGAPRGTATRLAEEYGVTRGAITQIKKQHTHRAYVPYHTESRAKTFGILGLYGDLQEHGILHKKKFLPDVYLRGSFEQRLKVLQGLIDTDGSVTAAGRVEFSNTNLNLANAVRELCWTLGIKTTIATRRKTSDHHKTAYRVSFVTDLPVATVQRKLHRIRTQKEIIQPGAKRHFIKSVTRMKSIPVKCIAVDNDDHMYLVGRSLIPTHNSGILNIHPPSEMPEYEPSKRLLTWPNGSRALVYSAEVPDALRGIQAGWSLADEIGTWETTPDSSGLTAWDNLVLATRLGERPQILAMTTPRRTRLIRDLLADAEEHPDRVLVRRSRTSDNQGNLSQAYIDAVVAMYEGTSLAAQELEGQMLDDVEGSLWTLEELDETRVAALPSDLFRPFVVVGVDPSVAENPRDECGIVVAVGTSERNFADRQVFVLEDASLKAPPSVWAVKVAEVAKKYGGVVIAEQNQGGALIRTALENVDPLIRVVGVHSRVGKALRAEPVQMATQQGRVHMVGSHPALEDQMCSWQPEVTKKSPDRVDAFVHAVLAVITDASRLVSSSPLRISRNSPLRATAIGRAMRANGAVAYDANGNPMDSIPDYMRASVAGPRRRHRRRRR